MYIDPGAGSIIFQVVAASAVAVLASASRLRRSVGRLLERFRRR